MSFTEQSQKMIQIIITVEVYCSFRVHLPTQMKDIHGLFVIFFKVQNIGKMSAAAGGQMIVFKKGFQSCDDGAQVVGFQKQQENIVNTE